MQHMFNYSLLYIIFINLTRLEQAHNRHKEKQGKERTTSIPVLQTKLEEEKKEMKRIKT